MIEYRKQNILADVHNRGRDTTAIVKVGAEPTNISSSDKVALGVGIGTVVLGAAVAVALWKAHIPVGALAVGAATIFFAPKIANRVADFTEQT